MQRMNSTIRKKELARIRSQFTDEEIKAYRKQFEKFDLNGDGMVSAKELDKASKQMGYQMSKSEIKAIMEATDVDDSGFLNFDEFLVAMPANSYIAQEEHRAAEIRRKFMEYDRDRDGHVTVREAHEILRRELAFTPKQSVQLVEKYDTNGDGQLSYEEFVNFYKKVSSKAMKIKELFQEFDRDQSGSVSVEEAKLMLAKLQIPEDEVKSLMEIHDKNKDGELQYEEFVAFLLHN